MPFITDNMTVGTLVR